MQIDLTPNDVRILKEALDAWEQYAHLDAMSRAMMTSILGRGEETQEARIAEMKAEIAKGAAETRKRRDQSTLVRAALIRAEMQASEHENVKD